MMTAHDPQHPNPGRTLAGALPGGDVAVVGFTDGTAELRERLLAYGLIPGQTLRVLAQKPLTVVQVEHTELALERELADCVEITAR